MSSLFFFFFSFFYSVFLLGQDTQVRAPNTQKKPVPYSGRYSNPNGPQAKKITTAQELQAMVKSCEAEAKQNSQGQKGQSGVEAYQNAFNKCLDKGMLKLNPEVTKKILNSATNDDRPQSDDLYYESTPLYEGLENYLTRRFSESVRGIKEGANKENPHQEQQGKFVDHNLYYELYRTQLAKNVMSTITSYCIYANSNNNFLISSDFETRKKQREENLLKLGEVGKGGQNAAYEQFTVCLNVLSHICAKTSVGNVNFGNIMTSSDDYAQAMACSVSHQLRELKNKQIQAEAIEIRVKQLSEQKSVGVNLGDQIGAGKLFKGQYEYGQGQNDKTELSVNELTSLTSNEFVKDAGMEEKNRLLAKQFEEQCLKGNGPQCQKLLNSNPELQAFYNQRKEWDTKTRTREQQLRGMKEQDLAKFLRSEMGALDPDNPALKDPKMMARQKKIDADIKKILQDAQKKPGGIEQLKRDIAARYRLERDKVIANIQEKMQMFNVSGGSMPLAGQQNGQKKQDENKKTDLTSTRQRALEKLKDQVNEVRDILALSNILTGLLELKNPNAGQRGGQNDDQKKKEASKSLTDPTMAWRELKNSALDPSKNPFLARPLPNYTSSINGESFKKIMGGAQKSLKPPTSGGGGKGKVSQITIQAEDINSILSTSESLTEVQSDNEALGELKKKKEETPKQENPKDSSQDPPTATTAN